MADDKSRNSEPSIAEPAAGARPSNREPRHDPGVIEGEATEIHAEPTESAVAEAPAATPPEEGLERPDAAAASPAPSRALTATFALALLGAVVGAALALGVAWRFDPRAAALDEATARWAELQDASKAQAASQSDLAARLDALGRRVVALEGAASADRAALAEARADVAKALASSAGAGQPAGAASALEARVGALTDRLAKVEAALAAPKSETRVAAAEAAPPRDGAAAAILAVSLDERLVAGAPFAPELAALVRLGADPAKTAALKPFAESGAPTPAALGAEFVKVAPAIVAAAAPPSGGGVLDRLLAHMRGLVRVRRAGEAVGADADSLVSQVSAALKRGDVAAALDAYARLPDAARQAGAAWAERAAERRAAGEAAQRLRADAISRLASAKD